MRPVQADPTPILVAVIGGGAMAATATISTIGAYLQSRTAKRAVVSHVEDEEGTIRRFEELLTKVDGKMDDVLRWQGAHEAVHAREDAERRYIF